jgi:glucose/arabinose dehydrogenase
VKLTRRTVYIALGIFVAIVVVLAGVFWWNFRAGRVTDLPTATSSAEAPSPGDTEEDTPLAVSLAQGLEIPWALDFLPDGRIILTERPGRIRLYDPEQGLLPEPLLTITEVAHRGEGGLLGIAVHPDFTENGFVYVYHTYEEGNGLLNRVVRFIMEDSSLANERAIIDGIPGASNHDGGRIKFGSDGLLYIATGDAAIPESAQDKNSLAGKILRLMDDGSIPPDNPFTDSPVYSYGHRNPQGLAWDDRGRLWATEHGSSATDELNLIQTGRNYGWPVIRGDEGAAGMEKPVRHSGSDTWAPSGLAFLDGSLYYSALRGQSLFQAVIENGRVTLSRHLERDFGRLREVVIGPDGLLYLLTSNRDGRGLPTAEDDQLIVINPQKLR